MQSKQIPQEDIIPAYLEQVGDGPRYRCVDHPRMDARLLKKWEKHIEKHNKAEEKLKQPHLLKKGEQIEEDRQQRAAEFASRSVEDVLPGFDHAGMCDLQTYFGSCQLKNTGNEFILIKVTFDRATSDIRIPMQLLRISTISIGCNSFFFLEASC